jgi:protein-L-isoaspartate(D-aspartate) O-methyltransferase
MDRLQPFRSFYAELITTNAGARENARLTAAFASTPRERFVGAGPWKVFTRAGYLMTPSDDPALLYQDIVVALADDRQINNGQPLLHAACLATLRVKDGETVVHVGAGTGYYTALLAHLVGPSGSVVAYEIEADLAQRATANLADLPNVTVHNRSAAVGPLPDSDDIYVNAGATAPLRVWLDTLRAGGRLLFPLTPAELNGRPAPGAMLLVTKISDGRFDARFVCAAAFIACAGARDQETAAKLSEAFARGDMGGVQSLRLDAPPDETCWCAGKDWWLSTAPSS